LKLCFKIHLPVVIIVFFYSSFCFTQNDCVDAIIACGNSNINLDVGGIGTQELVGSNSCSMQENNSIWLQVTAQTSGTLGFNLRPTSTAINEDYDFAVFGPNVTCNNKGISIRCSANNPRQSSQGNNLTGMNGTETDTSEGPGNSGNSFVRWLDAAAGDTYFIVIDRPIGNSSFILEWTGTATFSEPPTNEATTSGTVLNLDNCDVLFPFNDGFTNFNLEENTNKITGIQTNVTITYHTTESDAIIGINRLLSPYTNNRNPQTIYARIENNTTNCFEIINFNLGVNLGPSFFNPINYSACDNLDDGDDTNGRVRFNLQELRTLLIDGQDPSNFDISFYNSETDASTKTSALSNSYYNTIPFNEEIYIRVEDIFNPDCKTIESLNLQVNANPEAFNTSLLQCDEDGTIDGITLFNLNEANETITNGLPNLSTKFYTDATRTQEIDGSSYFNTQNPQIIYTEINDNNTGCISNSELTIQVSTTNSNNALLVLCDDDGVEDGLQTFNLNNAENQITNGLPMGLSISYFETYEDALLEINNLETSYSNTNPYSQTIYARVENINNCYGISEVTLTVNELPNIETENLRLYCLNTFPEPIALNAGLINDLPTNYSYNWTTGENTFQIEINTIGNYSVTVTNANGCSKNRTITVEPSNTASFESIEIIDVTQNNTITVLVSGEGIYEYRLLDEDGIVFKPYQEDNIFENVSPGIYTVAVRDIKNDCGIVNDKVSVIGFPKFFTPNNDGFNDTWQVYGVSSMFQTNSKIFIYNRYGKLLEQITPMSNGWDGTYNGEILPADDYWFSVQLEDGRNFKSHFSLKN